VSPAASGQIVAGAEVRIGGHALDPKVAEVLIEVRVHDNLRLPNGFQISLADPALELVDGDLLKIGAEVEILFAAPDAKSTTTVIKGQIAAVEPEFGPRGAVLAARGYDHSHGLHRTKRTQTYQNMTADDIARKVCQKAGLQPGTIDSAGAPHDFVQQNNETDWELLWRLALALDFEVEVDDKKLHFRKARRAGGGDGAAAGGEPFTLRWGDTLLDFRPRVTGVQQVDEVVVRGWDPKTKRSIEATAKVDGLSSQIGIPRDEAASALGGGTLTIADRPVATQAEAAALARSVAAQVANSFVEAEGVCRGDPRVRAGSAVKIDGVGKRFGGVYTVSATTHVFRGTKGYETRFTIAGRNARTLVDLVTPSSRKTWGNSVVVGIVTQNEDPEGLGRVRVKYPALGDGTEGWWARVATPSAGKDRGLMMLPVVGEEVVIAFEHDDVRHPYVLGSVWNGDGKPGHHLVKSDGSFGLRSDKAIAMRAGGDMVLETSGDLKITSSKALDEKIEDDITIESGKRVVIKAGSEVVIEAGTELSLKAGTNMNLEATGQLSLKAALIGMN
jgi:uncharacterized protein involved in type VI secretion and phage assembly